MDEVSTPQYSPEEIDLTIRELESNGYRWELIPYKDEETGELVHLVQSTDLQTGISIGSFLPNKNLRNQSISAWLGARQSRSPGTANDILKEITGPGASADDKLTATFVKYGHASVADAATPQIEIGGLPMYLALEIFNNSPTHAGQEKSTRYQSEFGEPTFLPLSLWLDLARLPEDKARLIESQYNKAMHYAVETVTALTPKTAEAFIDHFGLETDTRLQKSNLNSRVLDTLRGAYPLGLTTGMSFKTSAREFSRIIAEFMSAQNPVTQRFAAHLKDFLSPSSEVEEKLGFKAESAGLIRHTEPHTQALLNTIALKDTLLSDPAFVDLLEIEANVTPAFEEDTVWLLDETHDNHRKLIAQHIITAFPGLRYDLVLNYLQDIDLNTPEGIHLFRSIVEACNYGFTNYETHPTSDGVRADTFVIECGLGEVRDLNRHRGDTRFVGTVASGMLPIGYEDALRILGNGYGLSRYLTEIEGMADVRSAFESRIQEYYGMIYHLMGLVRKYYGEEADYTFIRNMLPLNHRDTLVLHSDPKQNVYLPALRVKPGGLINYRVIAWEMMVALLERDTIGVEAYLREEQQLPSRPDASNKAEFLDRN